MRKLSSLRVGESGVIDSFIKDDISIKLMEMGCVPGELVKIEQIAPLGDPICILVAGYSLSLRLDEADNIVINSTSI
jgi:ferrous iron transport protein A